MSTRDVKNNGNTDLFSSTSTEVGARARALCGSIYQDAQRGNKDEVKVFVDELKVLVDAL